MNQPERVTILGAGIAGLVTAFVLARRGASIEVVEAREGPGLGCSWYAGGMIAPWCEREGADEEICVRGQEALRFWTTDIPVATRVGSLVVAPPRDASELRRFARRTTNFDTLDADRLAELEPDLAGRFSSALFFPQEAHLEPRRAVAALFERLSAMDHVRFRFGATEPPDEDAWVIDARGLAARDHLPPLRGVKGEMVVLRTRDIKLSRPVRLIHPRYPIYVVPRPDGSFMVGATSIENEERGRVTARGLLELLGAAYALHPAFGEAEVVEMGCDLRPAFPDNLPRVVRQGRRLHVNGLYRHGFLLSPALAREAAETILGREDAQGYACEDHSRERRALAG